MVNSSESVEYMDTDPSLVELIPSDLWSLPYLQLPGILPAATRVNPVRVGEVCSAAHNISLPSPNQEPQVSIPRIRTSAPPIQPYDGKSSTLRAFSSQLVNEIQSDEAQFPTEMSKVRFAYRCLGPGALAKMRSSFRCLEDPSIPAEITTLKNFLLALKQRCQDPSLCEKASLVVDSLYQKNTNFHDFITVFEDNMADSTYANIGKSQWKIMLQRRLSIRLRNALVTANDVPSEYHAFVAYLREKDAAFQEIQASRNTSGPSFQPRTSNSPHQPSIPTNPSPYTPHPQPLAQRELTVSQGGSAMDLDTISEERGPDGRLTVQAKNARRALGRCLRCNTVGHIAINCPLTKFSKASISTAEPVIPQPESLKD